MTNILHCADRPYAENNSNGRRQLYMLFDSLHLYITSKRPAHACYEIWRNGSLRGEIKMKNREIILRGILVASASGRHAYKLAVRAQRVLSAQEVKIACAARRRRQLSPSFGIIIIMYVVVWKSGARIGAKPVAVMS